MEFRLLGRFEAEHDGMPVAVGRRRERCLLALLLLEANTVVPVARLVELLWDEAPPVDPRATLHTYIARLRTHLDPDGRHVYGVRLMRAGDGYLVQVDPDAVDALRFRALVAQARLLDDPAARVTLLREARRLWRGPIVADIASDRLRARLAVSWQEAWLAATEAAIEAEMACGHSDEAVGELRSLMSEHPYRERFIGLLMLALYRTGRQAEALGTYQSARRTLIDQLGLEPGSELRDLHQRILASDTSLLTPPSDLHSTAAASPGAVPRQLPAAPRHFTGRRAELDTLTGLLEHTGTIGGTIVISAIDGMAGIGKTALAVHAAHRLAERFPDGQLFLDLHGYTKMNQPRSPHEALDTLLHSLGVAPQQIPRQEHERAALYRQCLAGTRTLIVLDNAADESQVRPLLPGSAGCLVLVTSRRRLKALDDAATLSLDVLPDADARTLLRSVAGPDRVQVEDPQLAQVVHLCGRLPLALRIAAALLRHRPSWSLAHLAGKLRASQADLTAFHDSERDLKAVFDLSYQALSASQQCLFRRLGLIPGPDADAYAGAALLEADPARAEDLLQELTDHNLLVEAAPGRYRMHDLLRAHARTLANTTELADQRERTLERLFEYYQQSAAHASALIARLPRKGPVHPRLHAPPLQDPDDARAWLRTERVNLEAAFDHAASQGWDSATIALGAGLAELLHADGPWTRAIAVHEAATAAADRHGQGGAKADALIDLGRVQCLTNDYPGATDNLTRALQIYRELGNRLGQANAIADQGTLQYLTGDYPGATDNLTQALQIYRELGNRRGQAHTLTRLGSVERQTADYAAAADTLTRALTICRELGDQFGQAYALVELGNVRRLSGQYPDAIDVLTQALEICRDLGQHLIQANALADLGRVQYLAGNLPGAIGSLTQALETYRGLGHRLGQAYALTELGHVNHLADDLPAAADALGQALGIYREIGHRGNEAWALNHYAAVIAATGDLTGALALYHNARQMNSELDKPDDEALALEGIGECILKLGDIAAGITHLRQALAIFQRLGMHPDTARVKDRLTGLTGPVSWKKSGEPPAVRGQ